jgi:hypothetical protein
MENEIILSKRNETILLAFSKGYLIDENGNISYKNKFRKLKKVLCNKTSYYVFGVRCLDNTIREISVHRYQAYIKYGNKIFEKGIEVRHYNGNSLDNSWDNILIGTHSDNIMDIKPEIRMRSAIKASYTNRRFNDEEVKSIINDHNNGLSYNKLCVKYNTSKSTLSFLFNEALYAK